MDIYQIISFSQRGHIFESILLENSELSRTNPPYPSAMFLDMSRQVISLVSFLLGYPNDQWVDEVIFGFLSAFSCKNPSILFNYSKFMFDAIHDQFLNFIVEGSFKHQSILIYLFLYHQ